MPFEIQIPHLRLKWHFEKCHLRLNGHFEKYHLRFRYLIWVSNDIFQDVI